MKLGLIHQKFRPAGREKTMLLSARAESNQRRAKGAPSMNTWLTPVFIGVAPLDPHYGGTPSCQIGRILPATRIQDLASSLPRGHWPLPGQKFQSVCAVRTPPTLAKPWQLVHPTTAAPNRKVCTRRCAVERQCFQILMAKGPSGPRVEWEQNLILPAGTDCRTKVTRSRKRGPGPTPPVRGRWPEGPEGVGIS